MENANRLNVEPECVFHVMLTVIRSKHGSNASRHAMRSTSNSRIRIASISPLSVDFVLFSRLDIRALDCVWNSRAKPSHFWLVTRVLDQLIAHVVIH